MKRDGPMQEAARHYENQTKAIVDSGVVAMDQMRGYLPDSKSLDSFLLTQIMAQQVLQTETLRQIEEHLRKLAGN